MTVTHNAEEKLESGTGAIQPVLDDIEKHIEVVNEATQRIKAQMDSAAAFKWARGIVRAEDSPSHFDFKTRGCMLYFSMQQQRSW